MRFGAIAAAGAAAATVASSAAADPAGAASGDNLVIGSYNNVESDPTQLVYNSGDTFQENYFGLGVADHDGPPAGWADGTPAIAGYAKGTNFGTGVQGVGVNGNIGVQGSTDMSQGVRGSASAGGVGVLGSSTGAAGVGVYAESHDGPALFAATFDTTAAKSAAIVATSSGGGSAIVATNQPIGTLPVILSTSDSAAPAMKAVGKAVPVHSPTVPVAGNGAALTVQGVAAFTRSGVASIAAHASSIVVTVPGGLTSSSHVLATLQTLNGADVVKAAVPAPATGKITIYLSAAPTTAVKVAWFVFG